MLEYIFFDEGLRTKFADFARDQGIPCQLDDADGLMASLPEDLDEAVADAIDEYYERLLQENAELLEGTEDALEKSAAGVQVQLGDGSPCNIVFDPDLLARLLGCISLEELRDMVQSIAQAVENPDGRPICQILADREAQQR